MSDIFLSYARADKARVMPIVQHLEAQGWSVFWDNNIPPGQRWADYIERHLNKAKCLVVVWSENSVRSDWVLAEAEEGRKKNMLVPLKIDQVDPPLVFRSIQAADMTAWNNDAGYSEFNRLVDAIAALVPKPVESKVSVEPSISREPVHPTVAKETVVTPMSGQLKPTEPKNSALVWSVVTVIIIALISWFVIGHGYLSKPVQPQRKDAVSAVHYDTTKIFKPRAQPKAPVPAPKPEAKVISKQKVDAVPQAVPAAPVLPIIPVAPVQPRIPQNFVLIKGRTFSMGSSESEVGHQNNETQHKVKLNDFAISKYEVTVGEYLKFAMETKRTLPDDKEVGDHFPVVNVSWNDAMAYCKWLTKKRKNGTYRLPTEAEWEYACRAGTATPFNTGENLTTDQANYNGIYSYRNYAMGAFLGKTVPVDSFQPNGYELYNMHGNVWEWCSDWYGEEYYEECLKQGVVGNPQGPSSGSYRVLRGGSWNDDARGCRSAYRYSGYPGYRFSFVGFRLVFVPQS
jgi:sulfatase modifying factor 1